MSGLLLDTSSTYEAYDAHVARLGRLHTGTAVLEELESSSLRGRGGAGFPVAAKWKAVAQRAEGNAVVLVNGAEGEPLSGKDRLLMTARPHLVLDGALLAAETVSAKRLVLYVGAEHGAAYDSMKTALSERTMPSNLSISVVRAPTKYVAGEESAAVHCVNDSLALPQSKPPRPFEKGVDGRPTLINNVETLAHVAMIARSGAAWFRSLGTRDCTGSILVTLSGGVNRPGVREVPQGSTLREAIAVAGGSTSGMSAVLLGGYFGTWVPAGELDTILDSVKLRAAGRSLGCGVIHVLPENACVVSETAAIVSYLSAESARQCGPCHFGLKTIAGALARLATNMGQPDDLVNLLRWSREIRGRGGCGHPDGAGILVESALTNFTDEFVLHQERQPCTRAA